MQKITLITLILALLLLPGLQSCQTRGNFSHQNSKSIPLDSTSIATFFESRPAIKKYEKELTFIYRNYDFMPLWMDEKEIRQQGNELYNKFLSIEDEGIYSTFPYQPQLEEIFNTKPRKLHNPTEADLLLTSLYLYYVDEVYHGLDPNTTTKLGWLLPRKEVEPAVLLDTIIADQQLEQADSLLLFNQYYLLRDALKHYRNIAKKGGWGMIETEENQKPFRPRDSVRTIQQIRERLFITGELVTNSRSAVYDEELAEAVQKYQIRNGFNADTLIRAQHLAPMNVPVDERIRDIVVNMERCRWISPEIFEADQFIFVNIPAYRMNIFKEGKAVFDSPVVVGDQMTKTVIFGGMMSYIVFSPYWNLPQSIIDSDVIPAMKKDKDYLKKHNLEWNNGQVRQLPGRYNSLGQVKFMFPNSNDIYLHDSPAKSLFKKEDRAKSHGCVRVEMARDLALLLLQDDENWTPQKIDAAMRAGKETIYSLKNEIPVYIGYFTTWVDDQGQVNFYKDVYNRNERLAELLVQGHNHTTPNLSQSHELTN